MFYCIYCYLSGSCYLQYFDVVSSVAVRVPGCLEWWGVGVFICLERVADMHSGPADATATHCLLLQYNPDWTYLFGSGSLGSTGQKAVKLLLLLLLLFSG